MYPRVLPVLRSFSASLFSFFRFHNLVKVGRKAAITGLMLALVSNQALAGPTPVVIAGTITDLGMEARFWWYASGWATTFSHWFHRRAFRQSPKGWDGKGAPEHERPGPEEPESPKERESRVANVKIYPGDVRIETGEQVVFNAIAYDANGASIGGLEYHWTGLDVDKNVPVEVSPRAAFISASPGSFKVTADVAGHQDQVTVTVTGFERKQMLTGQRLGTFSTLGSPQPNADSPQNSRRGSVGQEGLRWKGRHEDSK